VAILPGSRTQELIRNLPIMLRAAAKLAATRPDVRFAVACLHERHQGLAREIMAQERLELPLVIHAAKTPELIRLADVAWAVSGSVGLELMVEALPSVVLYKIRPFDLWVASFFIKAKFISLVNLLADAEVMPEYLTSRDVSGELADWARTWLSDPTKRQEAATRLAVLRDRVAVPGASDRAADRIVQALDGTRSTDPNALRGTHGSRRVHRGHASR
jgi:lipid-A-disaccharide synthase